MATFPPSRDAIYITGLGMVSPLGHNVVTSCAAARAGLSRAAELKVLSYAFGEDTLESEPVVIGHAVSRIGEGFSGAGKLIALGAAALQDLLARREIDDRWLRRTGIVLNLSDCAVVCAHASTRPHTGGVEGASVDPLPRFRGLTADAPARIASAAGAALSDRHQATHHGGSAGFALAVADALQMLRGGAVDRCIVGAIDSRVEPSFLVAADALGLLRTNVRPTGLIPGEAAAFMLLERAGDALAARTAPIAQITGVGHAKDPTDHFGDVAASGAGLAQAIRAARAGDQGSPRSSAFTIGDLNGTERRARAWGLTLAKLQRDHLLAETPLWLPAMSFGDTGAASGGVALCLAARAFERRYAPGREALLWLSSESGACAALGVAAAPG